MINQVHLITVLVSVSWKIIDDTQFGSSIAQRCPNSLAGSEWKTSDVKAELDLLKKRGGGNGYTGILVTLALNITSRRDSDFSINDLKL